MASKDESKKKAKKEKKEQEDAAKQQEEEEALKAAAAEQDGPTFRTTGRFYEDEFPEVETTVVVNVQKMDEKIGAYVTLLEYDGKEGMINLGELSKKRIRSMTKVLRVGSTEVCMVMSVDDEKGYINLSKKRVEPEDAPVRQEAYAKAKAVHGVMQHVASNNDIPVEELCNKVSWPLYKKFSSAYEAFKKHTQGEIDVWEQLDFTQPGLDISSKKDDIIKDIETHMKRRLITSVMRLQAKCEVSCNEYAGIDAIKAALTEGLKASKPDCEVNIKLIAHPMFALTCLCRDKELGVNVLNEAMDLIRAAIEKEGGVFALVSKPDIQQKEDPAEKEKDDGSDSDGSSETEKSDMGDLDDAALKELEKKKVDSDDDEK